MRLLRSNAAFPSAISREFTRTAHRGRSRSTPRVPGAPVSPMTSVRTCRRRRPSDTGRRSTRAGEPDVGEPGVLGAALTGAGGHGPAPPADPVRATQGPSPGRGLRDEAWPGLPVRRPRGSARPTPPPARPPPAGTASPWPRSTPWRARRERCLPPLPERHLHHLPRRQRPGRGEPSSTARPPSVQLPPVAAPHRLAPRHPCRRRSATRNPPGSHGRARGTRRPWARPARAGLRGAERTGAERPSGHGRHHRRCSRRRSAGCPRCRSTATRSSGAHIARFTLIHPRLTHTSV